MRAMFRLYSVVLLAVTLIGFCHAAPLSSCSEDCVQYLLSDASGPKILRLYKELLRTDSSGPLTPVDVNGQTYDVSFPKKNLIQNAIRKGIKETVIEGMLDDAAIVPTGSAVSSTRHTQQTVEPSTISQRRPGQEPLTSQSHYRVYTKSNGDVNIDVKGQTLKVPDDLHRLPQIESDTTTLNEIIRTLQEFGVPVKREGNRVSVTNAQSPQGLTLRVSIKKIDDKPSSVTITANDDKYTLPGDESSLNRYLRREPDVAYHILRILSTHGVPVEFDPYTKSLKATLSPEADIIGSRSSGVTSSGQKHTVPSASSPKVVRIGSSSYYLPEDWDRLKRDLQDGKVSARSVLDTLDTEHITPPSDVYSVIRTRITTSVGKVRVMRYGDDVTVELGSRQFKLPVDERALERALKENDFPIELIRDSLLRIGIDSRRVGGSLRLILPGGEAYLTGLPTTKQYEYKITSRPGAVEITAGSESYILPTDKLRLESDIASKKMLPRTLVDAFNDVGIHSQMDIDKQEMVVDLPSTGTLRIPVPLSVHKHTVGSRLRLNVRGPEGNKVYTLTVGDSGDDKIELPSEVHILNNYIRSGKVDSSLLLQLLSRMGVAHYFDSAKDFHIVTFNNRPYEINNSQLKSSGGFISDDCSVCQEESHQPHSQQQTTFRRSF